MKTILIATKQTDVTHGHGDYGTETALATYGGYSEIKFPAFKNKEDYERFRREKNIKSYLVPTLLEIEIYNPEYRKCNPEPLTQEVWMDYLKESFYKYGIINK